LYFAASSCEKVLEDGDFGGRRQEKKQDTPVDENRKQASQQELLRKAAPFEVANDHSHLPKLEAVCSRPVELVTLEDFIRRVGLLQHQRWQLLHE
jgi:hypothetical protein